MAEKIDFNLDALQAMQELTLGTNYVERWQGTPQLLPYNVSTHAYNCAMLYMQLCHICEKIVSVQLLSALLCHDNMESLTGDLLAPAKDAEPESWNNIEKQAQEKWRKAHNIPAKMSIAFLPIEENFSFLTKEDQHLLKIIDMLEFLLHAQQEYKAGNRSNKVMDGLKYGGESLRRRISTVQKTFGKNPELYRYILDLVTCIRYYYNRQCRSLGFSEDYYV